MFTFFFLSPVEVSLLADYSIHIRHPMCFQTLKEKLDNSFTDTGLSRGGGGNSYTTYGQFLKDLRLIFKNAKTYCAVHMEADEISRTIYDSAVMLGDLMEGWISKEFSVDIAEKVLMHQIKSQVSHSSLIHSFIYHFICHSSLNCLGRGRSGGSGSRATAAGGGGG